MPSTEVPEDPDIETLYLQVVWTAVEGGKSRYGKPRFVRSIDVSELNDPELEDYITSDRFGYTHREPHITSDYRLVQTPKEGIIRVPWPVVSRYWRAAHSVEGMLEILRGLDNTSTEVDDVLVNFWLYNEPFTYDDWRQIVDTEYGDG